MQPEAFFSAQPRVGKNSSGVKHSGKITVIELRHNLSHSSGVIPAWRKMLRIVPTLTSACLGTMATRVPSGVILENLT
jgi:hypothetical protein